MGPERLLFPRLSELSNGVLLNMLAGIGPLKLVRLPMAPGMEPDRLFWLRTRYWRRRRRPRAGGIGPVRLALVRLRTERKERLP
ncbi:hypothetical protein PVAP13_2NG081622, partial [Panicum virgatum]